MAELLIRKIAIKLCFIFPPHLTSASALPDKVKIKCKTLNSIILNYGATA